VCAGCCGARVLQLVVEVSERIGIGCAVCGRGGDDGGEPAGGLGCGGGLVAKQPVEGVVTRRVSGGLVEAARTQLCEIGEVLARRVARVDVVAAVVEGVEFVEDGPAVAVKHDATLADTAVLERSVDADTGVPAGGIARVQHVAVAPEVRAGWGGQRGAGRQARAGPGSQRVRPCRRGRATLPCPGSVGRPGRSCRSAAGWGCRADVVAKRRVAAFPHVTEKVGELKVSPFGVQLREGEVCGDEFGGSEFEQKRQHLAPDGRVGQLGERLPVDVGDRRG
jgi:hypothetical protein